jgi:predicted CXXCH cytochrome family protein
VRRSIWTWARVALLASLAAVAAGQSVDPVACRSCHREIYERYSTTPMARSFYRAENAAVIEDWDRNNRFYHQPSDRYYEMTRRNGKLFVRRYQQDESRQPMNSLELAVTHIMGSGMRARSYLHQTAQGWIVELPVSWYSQEQSWGMAPGYDRPRHPDFSRTVNHKCMFCHNAYPDFPNERARQGWDADISFPVSLPSGIDCQRCHGPGGQHVRDASARSIVNPARLSPDRQMDLCMQCHLESTTFRLPDSYRRFGRGFYSYVPGEPLADYMVHFDHASGTGHDDKFEIVSAAYRLRKSACFVKSKGRMVCTTCHDAHHTVPPEGRASYYRQRCMGCHSADTAFRHKMEPAAFGTMDCLPCHMPMRRTEDVVHVAMTDHNIMRRRPDGDLLAPRREKTEAEQAYSGPVVLYDPQTSANDPLRDVYLGIAQVKEKANLRPGVELLARALRVTKVMAAEPYFELAEAQLSLGLHEDARKNYVEALSRDPAFAHAENNLANLLSKMGRSREAIVHHRRALVLDPASAELHRNLGLALMQNRDFQSAGQAFRDAVATNPLYAPAWQEYGAFLLSQGQIDEARTYLSRALVLDPANPKTHNNLGLVLIALGERSLAVPHLRFALRHGDAALREATNAVLKRLGIEMRTIDEVPIRTR